MSPDDIVRRAFVAWPVIRKHRRFPVVPDGGQLLRAGVYSGITGVVRQPIRGAREAGAKGFVQGVGKGAIGIIAKPASGAAAMISKTAEGAASEVKQLTSGKGEVMLRVRQPRELRGSGAGSSDGGVLLPYPRCFTVDM